MRKFKTESKRLLDLMINSIYTNKEIFLRELVSNASDALDKLYLTSLQAGDDSISRNSLHIDVAFDPEARTITISDNGIGMDEESLEKNLGTIAHSGSLEFKSDEEVASNDDVDIIGQFGVGFYSSFMVASKVSVVTRPYGGEEAFTWESDGIEGYTMGKGQRDEQGTTITLTLRESNDDADFDEYLSEYTLRNLIKRYSDYVRYPIRMETTSYEPSERPEDADDDWQPEYNAVKTLETINSMVPIWTKKKSDVTDEEYNEFYKAQFHEFSDPASVISIHAEGTLNYDALLFIPSEAPRDLYSRDFEPGLALYSSGVLIMEKCADLLPDCFGFVQGVIDSPDLSLNISREMLQQDKQLKAMERRIEKKIKSELAKMRDDSREDYESIFKLYGRSLKYGIYSSYGAKSELLADLLLFKSAKTGTMLTLDEYLEQAGEEQEKIFFASGDTAARLACTPNVKAVTAKGFDVLLCEDQIDDFTFMAMGQYKEKQFANVASSDLDLATDEEKEEVAQANENNSDLFEDMTAALGGKVVKVVASATLADAAAAITSEGEMSLSMEKYFQSVGAEDMPESQRVLEINTKHPVFAALQAAQESGDADKVCDYAEILYSQALLAEGLEIDDPSAFNQLVCKLMK